MTITDEMIETAAHAAWRAYFDRDDGTSAFERPAWDEDGDEWIKEDTWPETGLYPSADVFRRCARAALNAALKVTA